MKRVHFALIPCQAGSGTRQDVPLRTKTTVTGTFNSGEKKHRGKATLSVALYQLKIQPTFDCHLCLISQSVLNSGGEEKEDVCTPPNTPTPLCLKKGGHLMCILAQGWQMTLSPPA